jgi:glycosyltransferase involved in cell wall biosynthesis
MADQERGSSGKRVVFVNRYFAPDHSATSQMLSDLAFHLASVGWDVCVIACNETYDGARVLPDEETIAGVRVRRVHSGGFGRSGLLARAFDYLVLYVALARGALSLLRPGDILVLMTDPPLLSIPLAVIARWRKALLVNWLQDLYPEVAVALGVPLLAGRLGHAMAYLRDRSLQAARVNVAIGELMAARLPAGNSVCIPNWADDEAIVPQSLRAVDLRAEWGLGARFVVGYSGNLGRAHECETLLQAAVLLKERADIAFLFIGGGHHVQDLAGRAQALGLSERFVFQPYQARERLGLSLNAPDVHWLSLRPELEGLIVPSKFYGIAAAGKPLIAVGALDGEIARIIGEHQCGAAVASGDAAGFARIILQLAADTDSGQGIDEGIGERMGERARALIDRRFARRLSFARWADLLDELAASVARF